MKILRIILFINLCITSVFAQQNLPADCGISNENLTAGALEKIVYKKYTNDKGKEKELKIGLVHPVEKSSETRKRPLIIGVHGGGFVDFCPFEPCYVKYSENVLTPNFTSQGFITASVQYRLTAPFDFQPPRIDDEVLRETQYKAAQDVRTAIKFLFTNAEKYNIDAEKVFLIGTSAGAITVLHAAYLDADESPKDLAKKFGVLEKPEKIGGVISLSGALTDLEYLAKGAKVPLLIVHGKEDKIVPFEKGFYLAQKHLTPVFGGKAVYEEALKNGIAAKGLFYDFGHAYPSRFEKEIYAESKKFILENSGCLTSTKNVNLNPKKNPY